MQFDNPMITFELNETDADNDVADTIDLDSTAEDSRSISEQIREEIAQNLNLRSAIHGLYYVALILGLTVFFLEVAFGIIDRDQITAMVALVIGLGIISTSQKSRMDKRIDDPNYIVSPIWRYVMFLFVMIGLVMLVLMGRDLLAELPVWTVAGYAGLVSAVNIVVLWQFTDEEFNDYPDIKSNRVTVITHYIIVTILSGLLLVLQHVDIPYIATLMIVIGTVLFIGYGGLFWTYAIYDTSTINVLSRITLSVMVGLITLPFALILLQILTVQIDLTIVILTHFMLCTLGFLTYHARPRFEKWLIQD